MFGMGFSEIVVIMLVSLVVIGPERMPKVARTLGHLWGRLQRYINQVKTEVTGSIELEELRELERKAREGANALERSVQLIGNDINHAVSQLEKELDQPVQASIQSMPPPNPKAQLKEV
jgi:sec-independent protein translocase protein TatB